MENNNKQLLIERILEKKLQGRKGRSTNLGLTTNANGTQKVCGSQCGEGACEDTDTCKCGFCYNDKKLVSNCTPDSSTCESKPIPC